MDIWVITKGAYEDERVVGVAASAAEAVRLIDERGPQDAFEEFQHYGPFKTGVIDLNAWKQ